VATSKFRIINDNMQIADTNNCLLGSVGNNNKDKQLSYRRGTARRSESANILSTAAQLYEKLHIKGLQKVHDLEGQVTQDIGITAIR